MELASQGEFSKRIKFADQSSLSPINPDAAPRAESGKPHGRHGTPMPCSWYIRLARVQNNLRDTELRHPATMFPS